MVLVQVAHARTPVHSAPMDIFEGFESWLRANNASANTVEDRVGVVRDFAQTHQRFPFVDPIEVIIWIGRPGYAPWTRATYYGHLRSFFTFALQMRMITVDPMALMRRPKVGKGVPRPLTPEQVDLVRAAADPTVSAWLILGFKAGLRAHEVAKIRGEDVQPNELFVLGKGGVSDFVPTHPAVWTLAQRMPRTGFWFPSGAQSGHVNSMTVSTLTSRLFASKGIHGSLHRCRHTFATELLRAGVNIRVVQTLMRHASLASTEVYCAVDECERRDAINRLAA